MGSASDWLKAYSQSSRINKFKGSQAYTSDAYHGFSTTVFSYKPSQAMTPKLKRKELFSYVIYSRQVHGNLHVELGRSEG